MNETYNDINVYIEKINAVIEEVKKRKYGHIYEKTL